MIQQRMPGAIDLYSAEQIWRCFSSFISAYLALLLFIHERILAPCSIFSITNLALLLYIQQRLFRFILASVCTCLALCSLSSSASLMLLRIRGYLSLLFFIQQRMSGAIYSAAHIWRHAFYSAAHIWRFCSARAICSNASIYATCALMPALS
jgi:hypothetical protein